MYLVVRELSIVEIKQKNDPSGEYESNSNPSLAIFLSIQITKSDRLDVVSPVIRLPYEFLCYM